MSQKQAEELKSETFIPAGQWNCREIKLLVHDGHPWQNWVFTPMIERTRRTKMKQKTNLRVTTFK